MKQIKFLAIMLAMMSICFGFVACGNDDDEPDYDWEDFNNSSSNDSSSSESTDYKKLISENVSVNATYTDYAFDITIYTTLSGVSAKYGIECGYGAYDYELYYSISGNTFTTTESIFLPDIYGEAYLCRNSYVALKADYAAGKLSGDTLDLYNECIKAMNKALNNGAKYYQGRIFVEISGTRYYVKSFSY